MRTHGMTTPSTELPLGFDADRIWSQILLRVAMSPRGRRRPLAIGLDPARRRTIARRQLDTELDGLHAVAP